MALNPLSIVLSCFDKIVSITTNGKITNNSSLPFDKYDAVAEIGIDLYRFKQMFGISTSYISVDDILNNDLQYLVYSKKLQDFNPFLHINTIVLNNPITTLDPSGNVINQHIQKDFVRYLAQLLFNTPFGVDLFTNETELCNSVSNALIQMWSSCLVDLQNISTNGSSPLLKGNVDEYYLDDSADIIHNICKELYSVMAKAPNRFNNLPLLEITDPLLQITGKKQYYLPFIHGDSINIRLTIKPNENQNVFGLSSTNTYDPPKFDSNGKLLGRTYLIKMKLILINFRNFFNWSLPIYLNKTGGTFTSIKTFFYTTFQLYLKFCFQNHTNCNLTQFIKEFKLYFNNM